MNMIISGTVCVAAAVAFTPLKDLFYLSLNVRVGCVEDVCDKVCGEGKEVHRENRMICSVQGLCIDLVYFFWQSFSHKMSTLTFICFFLGHNSRKIFVERGN